MKNLNKEELLRLLIKKIIPGRRQRVLPTNRKRMNLFRKLRRFNYEYGVNFWLTYELEKNDLSTREWNPFVLKEIRLGGKHGEVVAVYDRESGRIRILLPKEGAKNGAQTAPKRKPKQLLIPFDFGDEEKVEVPKKARKSAEHRRIERAMEKLTSWKTPEEFHKSEEFLAEYFGEEMFENLFGYSPSTKGNNRKV